jgi:hypothetical protein
MFSRRDDYTAFGHGGAVAGYQPALYMNRDKGIALVVLANALGPALEVSAMIAAWAGIDTAFLTASATCS